MELSNVSRLVLQLPPGSVGYFPPQFDRSDLLAPVAGKPDIHRLCDAAALLRFQCSAGLRLHLQLIPLRRLVVSFDKAEHWPCRWGRLPTLVTAVWKWSSESGCAMLFEKENSKFKALGESTERCASSSIFTAPLLTTALYSLGNDGASGGSADENDHSSSSFATAGAAARVGVGVAGLDEKAGAPSAANGSSCGLGGGAKTDDW